jgi:hypothetical protein
MLRDSYHRMFWEFTHSGMMSDFAGNLVRAGQRLQVDVWDVQDHLLATKISQSLSVNQHHSPKPLLQVSDRVMLSTKHRRREFLQQGSKCVAKFMPQYDGPYLITNAHPDTSTYTLDLPNSPNIFPTFHVSQLQRFLPNNSELFPSHDHP